MTASRCSVISQRYRGDAAALVQVGVCSRMSQPCASRPRQIPLDGCWLATQSCERFHRHETGLFGWMTGLVQQGLARTGLRYAQLASPIHEAFQRSTLPPRAVVRSLPLTEVTQRDASYPARFRVRFRGSPRLPVAHTRTPRSGNSAMASRLVSLITVRTTNPTRDFAQYLFRGQNNSNRTP